MSYKDIIYAVKSADRKAAIREELLPSQHPLIKPTKDISATNRSYPIVKEDLHFILPASDRRLVLLDKQAEQFQYQKQANIVYTRQFKILAKLLGNEAMEFDELRHKIENLILHDIPSQTDAAVLTQRISILERELARKNQIFEVNGKTHQNLIGNSNAEYMRAMNNELGRKSKLINELSGSINQQIFEDTYQNLQMEITAKNQTIKQIQEQAQDSISKSAAHIGTLEEELVKRNQTIQKLTFQLDTLKRKSQANSQEVERMKKRQRQLNSSLQTQTKATYKGINYSINSLLLQLQAQDSQITESASIQQQLQVEFQKIKSQNINLHDQLKECKSIIQDLDSNVTRQVQISAQRQSETALLKKQIDELQSQKYSIQKLCEDQRSQVVELKLINQNQLEEIRKLTVSIEQMRAAIGQYEISQKELMKDRQKYASSAGQLQISLNQSREVISNRQQELASIKEQINLTRSQKDHPQAFIQQSNYPSQIFIYEKQIADLTAKCEQSSRRQNKYHKDLQLYEEELKKIASHKQQFDGIIKQLHEKIELKESHNNFNDMDQQYFQGQVNRLLAEKNELTIQIHQKDDQLNSFKQEVQQLRESATKYQQLQQTLQQRQNLVKQVSEERNRERINYQTQFTDMRQVINQLQKKIEQQQQRYNQQLQQRKIIEQQLHNIRESLYEFEENEKKLERDNIQLRQINNELCSNISKLEGGAKQQGIIELEKGDRKRQNMSEMSLNISEGNSSKQQVRISLKENYDKEKQEWINGMADKNQVVSKMMQEKQQMLHIINGLRSQKQEIAFQLYRLQQSSIDEQALNSYRGISSDDKMINLSYSNAQNTPKLLASYLQQNQRMQRQLQMTKSQNQQLNEQVLMLTSEIKILKEKIEMQNSIIIDFDREKIQTQLYIKQKQEQITTLAERMEASQLTVLNLNKNCQELTQNQSKLKAALLKIQEYERELSERRQQTHQTIINQNGNLIRQELNQAIEKWKTSEQQRLITQQQLQQTNEQLIRCKQSYSQLRKESLIHLQTISKHQQEIQKYRIQNEELNAAIYTFGKGSKRNQGEEEFHIVIASKNSSDLEEGVKVSDKVQEQSQQNVSSLTRNILKDPSKISCQESRYDLGKSNNSNSSKIVFGKGNMQKQAASKHQIKIQQQKMIKKQKSSSAHEIIRQNYDADRQRIYSQNVRTEAQRKEMIDSQSSHPATFSLQDNVKREVIHSLALNSKDQQVGISSSLLTKHIEQEDKYSNAFNKLQPISPNQAQYLPQQSNNKRIISEVESIKPPVISQYSQQTSKSNFYKPVYVTITPPVYISRPSIIQQQMLIQRRGSNSRSQSQSKSKIRISYGLPNKPHQIKIIEDSIKQCQKSEISNSLSDNHNQNIKNQNSIHHLSSIQPIQSDSKTQKPQIFENHLFQKRQTIINNLNSQINLVHSKNMMQDRQKASHISSAINFQNNNQISVLNNLREHGTETIRFSNRHDGVLTRKENPPSYFSPKVVTSYSPKHTNIIFNSIGNPANFKERIRVMPITRAPAQSISPAEVKIESMEATKRVQMKSVMSGKRNSFINDTPSFGLQSPLKNDQLQNQSVSSSKDSGIQVLQYDWNAPCCRNI